MFSTHAPLTDEQRARYGRFTAFVSEHVEPRAAEWDRDQRIPGAVISMLGKSGYLGCCLPPQYRGQGWDTVTFGLLNEALGRGSSALAGVVTVQAMVSLALLKWGTDAQKNRWLPSLATGEVIGAFALTEPAAGSSLTSLVTELTRMPDGALVLHGRKRWISCAQFAGVFLVFGSLEGSSVACLVPRGAAGLTVEPIDDLLGFRGAGLGEVIFEGVTIRSTDILGRAGFALSHVAPVGLQHGRIATACSALGLLRGCVEDSVTYAASRRVGDTTVGDFGMIRSLIAGMGTDLEAGTWLCYSACQAEHDRRPEAFEKTLMAKYFTSKAAVRAASDAVQIRGASGCHASSAVSRYYRDAKIMEIIEGTTQIHENMLGRILTQQLSRNRDVAAATGS
jgi:alkylation response protein AidB-like acyl-CoA dehydrogenase